MNNIESIVIFLVVVVLLIQSLVFFQTLYKIRKMKAIFKKGIQFKLIKVIVPVYALQQMSVLSILAKLKDFKSTYDTNDAVSDCVTINIVQEPENANSSLKKIIFSINTYLIKNQGAASDFNLLKDIVERNCDAEDENINITVSIPLYLGLMGTMIGIVFGLFHISDISDNSDITKNLGNGINVLLSGVKVAMLASFTGLLLTILNSAWFYRQAKSTVEQGKNDFYTFLQTELLPVLNQSVSSTLQTLQANFVNFNNEFAGNMNKLSVLMGRNYEALMAQEEILQILQNLDIKSLAESNVSVLLKFQRAMTQFNTFNQYIEQLSGMIESTYKLTAKVDNLFERSQNFETLAEGIQSSIVLNGHMIKFLTSHEAHIDNSKQMLVSSVNSVNGTLDTSLKDLAEFYTNSFSKLKQHIEETVKNFNDQIPELPTIKEELNSAATHLAKLNLLSPMNDNIVALRAGANDGNMEKKLQYLSNKIDKMVGVLQSIELNTNKKEKKTLSAEILPSNTNISISNLPKAKKKWYQFWKLNKTAKENEKQ